MAMRKYGVRIFTGCVILIGCLLVHGTDQESALAGSYRAALKLIGLGHYEAALNALTDIRTKDRNFFKAYAKVLEIFLYKGDIDSARAVFEKILQVEKDNAGSYFGLGLYHAEKKDFPGAIENYKKAIGLFSGSFSFYQAFVNASERIKQTESAETYLTDILTKEPGNAAALWGLGYLKMRQRKPDEAMEFAEKAITLAPNEAVAYRLKCDILQNMSKFKEMLALALDKTKLSENTDPDLEIDFATRISTAYSTLGQYQQAFEFDRKSLDLAREIGNKRSLAIAFGNMGVHHANTGNFPEAMKLFYQKLAAVRELNDRGEEVAVLSNIGAIHDWQGEVQKSLARYNEALTILEELDNQPNKALIMGNMGAAFEKLSDYPRALDYYHQALKIFQDLKNKGSEAWILGNIGAVTSKLGNDREALTYLEKARVTFQEIGDKKYEGWVIGTMGAIYKGLGDHDKCLQCLTRALEIAKEIGDKRSEIDHLGNLGAYYQELGENAKSAKYFDEGLKIAEEIGEKVAQSEMLIFQGILHRALKDYDRSIADFQKSMKIGTDLGVLRPVWNSEWGLALTHEVKGDFGNALKHYKSALDTVESIRGKLVTEEQKVGFLGETIKIYEGLIGLLFKMRDRDQNQGHVEEAFQVAERAKSRSFLELLAEAKVNLASGIAQELENEEKALQKQLTEIQQKILDPEVKDKERESLYETLRSLESRYNDFILELRKKNPAYASVAYPEPYTLDKARSQLLDDKTFILEFVVGEEQVYLWAISREKVLWAQSFPRDNGLAEKIADYQTQIAQRKINYDLRLGKDIYEGLLKGALKNIPRSSHLIIIPDGFLLRFPFEALVKELKGDRPTYLLEDYVVSYAPSASVLGEVIARQRPSADLPADLLAMGNPVFEQGAGAAKNPLEYLRAGGMHLTSLPYAEEEVASIAKLYQTKGKTAESFVRAEALEEVIKSGKAGNCQTLHFATHGLIDDRIPALSGLLLAPSKKPGGDDGFLRLNEIFQLKLQTDLVTLSACETALGKEVRGEGMIGLTRAFFYAGTRSVMASLWMVGDQSTSILMKDFYAKYLDGEKPATALRLAKIMLLENTDPLYRHPFFWAPFIMMGGR